MSVITNLPGRDPDSRGGNDGVRHPLNAPANRDTFPPALCSEPSQSQPGLQRAG
jgi:hypothetical protein